MSQDPPTRFDQLKRALDAGLIDQDTFDAAVAGLGASISGGGAIAQGERATAVGAAGVSVRGDNYGDINTGSSSSKRRGRVPAERSCAVPTSRAFSGQAERLPLFAADSANAQVRLSCVYTALLTDRRDAVVPLGRGASAEPDSKNLSALDVLNAEPRLVLLGGPGSGKSTFANFVALCMAGEMLGATAINLKTLTAPLPPEPGSRDEEPQPQRWEHGALLPVQVVLRDLASELPPQGKAVNADTVWQHIAGRLQCAALGDFAPHLREELLKRGGLVQFDGLDEVPDAHNRREDIKRAVQDFVATFSQCRILVTSRTYAYQRQEWKLDGFAQVGLMPFTGGQIEVFVDAWYAHMVELDRLRDRDAGDRAEILKRAVQRSRHVRELAERPLLLTLIAKVQTEKGGALPEKREELYDKAVEMLLNEWEGLKVHVREDGSKEIQPSLAEWLNAARDDIRAEMNRLAFGAHRDQALLEGTADIPQGAVIDALLAASRGNADTKLLRLEEFLRDRAGILAAHGVGFYQFPHRSFQEYLAACHLTDDEFPDKLAALARADPNRWREVVLLAAAKAARGSSLNVWALSESLCVRPPPDGDAASTADQWGALLAGRVLVECADLGKVSPRDENKLARVREWQRAIIRHNTLPAIERALAGRSLAVLGDPRPEVMTLDSMHFCLVPPGPFAMGSDEVDEEKPQHIVDVAYPYFIGRFPVAVAQWREYIKLSGAAAEDEDSLRGRDNDPVTNVSWHEAIRFCGFLSDAWRRALPQGFVVTLPSEAEWEKAARGGRFRMSTSG